MARLTLLHGLPAFDYRQAIVDVLTSGTFGSTAANVDSATLSFGNISLVIAGNDFDIAAPRTISDGTITSLTLSIGGTTVAIFDSLPAGTTGGSLQSLLNAPPANVSEVANIYSFEPINAIGSPDADFLQGTGGHDTLNGGGGNDTLDGAGGRGDRFGGDGDDTIIVSTAPGSNIAYVRPGLGTNTVTASQLINSDGSVGGHYLSFTDLTAKVTVDLKAGTATASGMSTTFSNFHYVGGTHGNDVLKGGGSAETWEAFVGNAGKDKINGRGGFDFVFYDDEVDYGAASGSGWANGTKGVIVDLDEGTARDSYGDIDTLKKIEAAIGTKFKDKLTGDDKDNQFIGQQGKDTINGAGGDDTLQGGLGKDALDGGGGKDAFRFVEFGKSNTDTITGFVSRTDSIELEQDVFLGIGSKLDKDEFLARNKGHAAKDAEDRIIYNKKDGSVWYDQDGSGADFAAIKFAVLDDAPALKRADFDMI